jgi:methylmalonyl-CoA mutase N-terminal domain/subunit
MISDIEEIGVITGIENGWFRERIYSTDARRAKLTELGEKVVVGVNKYRLDADVPTDVLVIDQGYEEEEVLRIKQFRRNRTNDLERSEMLETVRSAANAETNVIEPLIAAVEVGCTMGEMADVLKDVYGEWEPGWRLA